MNGSRPMARDFEGKEVMHHMTSYISALIASFRSDDEGQGLAGEKYLLTNVSKEPLVLSEEEFDRKRGDVVAVSIETHNLAPGESTNVFVIRDGSAPWQL